MSANTNARKLKGASVTQVAPESEDLGQVWLNLLCFLMPSFIWSSIIVVVSTSVAVQSFIKTFFPFVFETPIVFTPLFVGIAVAVIPMFDNSRKWKKAGRNFLLGSLWFYPYFLSVAFLRLMF